MINTTASCSRTISSCRERTRTGTTSLYKLHQKQIGYVEQSRVRSPAVRCKIVKRSRIREVFSSVT